MSRYAYLVCLPTKKYLWLGKVISKPSSEGRPREATVSHFHIGSADEPPNSQRELLTKALWRFLAENTGRELVVMTDDQLEALDASGQFEGFQEIGGDTESDIPASEYVNGFRG